MDTDDVELAEQLMARAGALLEDASAIALLTSKQTLPERIVRVRRAVSVVAALTNAAASLASDEEDRSAACQRRT
jgi:phage I-like protein